jgi:hypothetical protein
LVFFYQPVNHLPNSITHLTFGDVFNKSVENLPKSIIRLTFYSNYQHFNSIPPYVFSIKILFDEEDEFEKINNLPDHLKEIYINIPNKKYLIEKVPVECKILFEEDDFYC